MAAKSAWFCYAQEPIGRMTLKGEPSCQPTSIVANSNSTGKGSDQSGSFTITTSTTTSVTHSITNSSGIALNKGFETTASVSSSDSAGGSASATAGVDGLFAHASATVEGHFDHTDESSQSQSQSGSFDVSYNGENSTASTEETTVTFEQTFANQTPAGEHCTFTVRTVKCSAKASGSIKIVADGVALTGNGLTNGSFFGFHLNELPIKDRTIEFPLTSDIHSDSTNADTSNDCVELKDDKKQSSKNGNDQSGGTKSGKKKGDKKGDKNPKKGDSKKD
ncbi:hypothetical protein DL96DRAFT_639168 [Flagelloscypha sp. PMI_526]|nr:hypothetical protein DL96DRAFT_639168 [Flagelloscypha sp. PMI_526]